MTEAKLPDKGYTLQHEMSFIAGLGSFAKTKHSRVELLQSYRTTLPQRFHGFGRNSEAAMSWSDRIALTDAVERAIAAAL